MSQSIYIVGAVFIVIARDETVQSTQPLGAFVARKTDRSSRFL